MVLLDLQDHRVQLVLRVLEAQMELKVLKVLQVQLVLKALKELRVSLDSPDR